VKKGQKVAILVTRRQAHHDTVVQVLEFDRSRPTEVPEISAGDICALVGLEVGHRRHGGDFDNRGMVAPVTIDEPTLDMVFRINDSPFAGTPARP